jgi:DNA-binding response OmpR family regulator
MDSDPQRRPRVLVVEDEWLIAEQIAAVLDDLECDLVGPVPSVRDALALLADDESIDAAMLDISLRREESFPIATALAERRKPFLFMSGYADKDLPQAFRDCRLLLKPASMNEIAAGVRSLLDRANGCPEDRT